MEKMVRGGVCVARNGGGVRNVFVEEGGCVWLRGNKVVFDNL